MFTRAPISPRRVLLGCLLDLAIVIPIVYSLAISHDREETASNADAATRASGVELPPVPAGAEQVIPPNAIPAIHAPQFVTVEQARVPGDAPMIAFHHGSETHAYSLRLLNGHEIVNDTVGGDPVAVTW